MAHTDTDNDTAVIDAEAPPQKRRPSRNAPPQKAAAKSRRSTAETAPAAEAAADRRLRKQRRNSRSRRRRRARLPSLPRKASAGNTAPPKTLPRKPGKRQRQCQASEAAAATGRGDADIRMLKDMKRPDLSKLQELGVENASACASRPDLRDPAVQTESRGLIFSEGVLECLRTRSASARARVQLPAGSGRHYVSRPAAASISDRRHRLSQVRRRRRRALLRSDQARR